ncbi:hypothetical protein GGR58DRAFT_501219 [Xylaria digitata]|nr:hypothetical protein GGR58DRAFT_501219 [Xylaria digitata]
MAKNIKWLGTALVSAAVVAAVPDSASITPGPSLPNPSADVIIAAIDPTSAGQVGINPVSVELGSPNDYVLTDLGPNNPVITWDGSVYHYIEGHTGYLTLETMTTTVDSQTSTMTSSVKVSVQTAAAGDPNQQAGAIGITFSEDVGDALRNTADAAIQACNLKRRSLSKRIDSISCIIDMAVEASGADGPLEGAATDEFWESIGVSIAENAPIIILAGYAVSIGPIAGVNIPAEGVGEPDKTSEPDETCNPSKPVNKDSPLCPDQDCQGGNDVQRCTTGPEKDRPCLLLGTDAPLQVYDQDWWDEQQGIISSIVTNPGLLGTAAPDCTLNSAGNAFDGKPVATPASWCICNNDGTRGIYPTVDTPSSPCAYTTSPTATISPMVTATSASITSCRTVTDTITGIYSTPSVVTFCTFNDNWQHWFTTWTISGTTSTGCLTPTSTTPSATATPTCSEAKKFTIQEDALVPAAERFCSDNTKAFLRPLTGSTYGNVLGTYNSTGASSGGQLYIYSYLDKGCNGPTLVDQNDCVTAFQTIFDRCDVGADTRNGGAASVNCQWYNITAVDNCVGTIDGVLHPEKCDSGYPLGYDM